MKKLPGKQLLFLLLINILLYLPSLFEPISYGDECIYLTLGQAFKKGLTFYRDIHDNKPPLLYLVAALANGKLFWFRLISLGWNLIHLSLVYELIKTITKKKWAPLFGGVAFTVLLLLFEGQVANGEVFMMTAATLAVALFWQHQNQKTFFNGLAIGLLFSLAFLFKIPVAFDLAGILLAIYILPVVKIKDFFPKLKEGRLWGIIFGFVLPITASLVYYAIRGGFTPYLRSALMQNIGYLASWQGGGSGLMSRLLILFVLTLGLFLLRNKLAGKSIFFFTWFIFALFGALLSGRPYPHYLIEVIPSLAILLALAFDKTSVRNVLFASAGVVLLIASLWYYRFWHYPIIPYYLNFLSYVSGQKTQDQYLAYWGTKTSKDYKLAQFVNQYTNPNDRVFFWGDGSCIYAIADRLPPGRYTVNYHIYDFDGFAETLQAIKDQKTKIIVKLGEEKRVWPELDKLLESDYQGFQNDDIGDRIYLKKQTKMVE
ncbi:MAG: hypothetical protein ABID04_01885 [Patescibacteria group bacterium]